jgi:hypothetical protein
MSEKLINAASDGDLETVRRLIENGENVNYRDKGRWTPLMLAAQNGHTDIVKFLISKGADPDAVNAYSETALCLAESERHTEICRILNERRKTNNLKPEVTKQNKKLDPAKSRRRGGIIRLSLLVITAIPIIIYVGGLFTKPDFSNILFDHSIINDDRLIMKPAINYQLRPWYINKVEYETWKLRRNGCIPCSEAVATVNIYFKPKWTLGGYWYGENCILSITDKDLKFMGKAEKHKKDWGDRLEARSKLIRPNFSCNLRLDSSFINENAIASMRLFYPQGAGKFSNHNIYLEKELVLTSVSGEKFISIINYKTWKKRFIYAGLSLLILGLVIQYYTRYTISTFKRKAL